MKPLFSLFLFLVLFQFPATAQNHTDHIIEAGDIRKIVLSSDEIYNIRIRRGQNKEIKITTDTEGEYYNQIKLDVETKAETLFLNSRYPEILQSGYDKLSAHKVFSMEVALIIPEGMVVEINSNVASVFLKGAYERVLIQLKTGSCYLEDFAGNAVINTYDGNILGSAQSINPEATSRHGTVEVPQSAAGIHKMVLTSINGDIKLTETK